LQPAECWDDPDPAECGCDPFDDPNCDEFASEGPVDDGGGGAPSGPCAAALVDVGKAHYVDCDGRTAYTTSVQLRSSSGQLPPGASHLDRSIDDTSSNVAIVSGPTGPSGKGVCTAVSTISHVGDEGPNLQSWWLSWKVDYFCGGVLYVNSTLVLIRCSKEKGT
jgi:hypothetical protein